MRACARLGRSALLGAALTLAGCGSQGRDHYAGSSGPAPEAPLPPLTGAAGASAGGAPTAPAVLFDGEWVQAEHTAPVVGGTLLVTRDGRTIVAADPDRDAVFLVDVATHALGTVSLEKLDEPGRVAEGPAGTVYVALRRAGALLAIDVATAAVTQRVPVCGSPRGIAYDANNALVHVACRTGQLVSLDAHDLSPKRALALATDLRDVIVREHDLVVTRFVDSEVLVVGDDGGILRRARPTPPDCGDATAAFRALDLHDGRIVLAHQGSSDRLLSGSAAGYYHVGCGGALVRRLLSLVDVDTPAHGAAGTPASDPAGPNAGSAMTFDTQLVPAAGPLDFAFTPKGSRVAAIALDDSLVTAFSSGSENPSANLWVATWDGNTFPDLAALERAEKTTESL